MNTPRKIMLPLGLILIFLSLHTFAEEKIKYRLTISVTGGGSVNPGVGNFYYDAGTTAFINAIPNADWAFDHWEGAVSGTDLYTQVVMDSNKTVTAVFVPAEKRLTIEHSGDATGFTSLPPGVYGFKNGQDVPISVGTSPNVYFGGWSGDVIDASEFIIVHMDSDKYINARFTSTGHILNISIVGEGGTTPGPMGNPHRYSADVIVSVKAYTTNSLWRFDHWEGDIGLNEPRYYILMELPMNQDRNITAVFIEKPWYNLTLEVIGQGHVSLREGFNNPITISTGVHNFSFIEWTYIRCERLLTTPGWKFLRWEGDYGDMSPTYYRCAFTMDKDRYVRCIFTNLTQMPNVIGMPQALAVTTIVSFELTIADIIAICSDDYPSGYVVSQDPLAGTTVEMGSTVSLWVSTGPCPVPVPHIIGKTKEEAESSLIESELILGSITEQCDDEAEMGTVIGQSPTAGELLAPGRAVNILISTGPCVEGEGTSEGASEGSIEGSTEGEGTYEGEVCVWNETCPNFTWQGTKYAQYFGLPWETCDTNNSSIPDSWEIEVVKYLLCSPTGIWNNKFICKFVENYEKITREPKYYSVYYSYRYVLAGMLTIGVNIDYLKYIFDLANNYYPFEYPDTSGIFPLLPTTDADNDGWTNYKEYEIVMRFNGSKESFIFNLFNQPPVPEFHSMDINQDNKISLSELLRIIQFFNSGGFHCDENTEDGYAPGYNGFEFSCPAHTADYSPRDWRINLTEILRVVQFFNTNGYQFCPFLSEDHYCPIL